ITYVLSSMRHFAVECYQEGYPVYYQATNRHFGEGLTEVLEEYKDLSLSYMTPSEWDSRKRLRDVQNKFNERITEIPNAFFFADAEQWIDKIEPGYRM
ncbi:MAG: cryptochrome/photolyase family protein, partial [Aliifodinibius sp.]|nr:cryptochrome/photolyase family protein [Fodinibius sp.]NIV10572.1 cryptochrome/photolyase family protein [Fodinibius sp.]NIY24185.1 cryptochrome/photolyase family protein [Fodinibius sp.]